MENWREITEDIVTSLFEDGSDPEVLYEVEHHFVSENFEKLEQAAPYMMTFRWKYYRNK